MRAPDGHLGEFPHLRLELAWARTSHLRSGDNLDWSDYTPSGGCAYLIPWSSDFFICVCVGCVCVVRGCLYVWLSGFLCKRKLQFHCTQGKISVGCTDASLRLQRF